MQKNVFQICKKSFRKLIAGAILLVASQTLFGATGSFFGKKNLRVTKTQWFDIIYAEESSAMAAILFENADNIYCEVTSLYDLTPDFRMPLVITSGVENLNAFWTAAPYNHIVLYDTSISDVGELSTYSETILSVFRHELTHAVTNNMKSKTWKGFTKVFGDPVLPGLALISTGIAEGATLTSESAAGEGRLNDEYSKHPVKQAKLENKFPSYYDVKGASDKYPYGSAYYFNGAFHEWLQEKYGMQAYAKFWFNVVNAKKNFINSDFKDAFGIGIKQAWKQFKEDYPVPQIDENPLRDSAVYDFFEPALNHFSKNNNSGSRYSSLTASENTLFWIDSAAGKIQYVSINNLEKNQIKPKTLLTVLGVNEINVSKDGRFLAVSYYSENGAGTKARLKIYDFETKKFFVEKETGLKNNSIIQKDGEYYLVANKYISPNDYQCVKKLNIDDNKLTDLIDVNETIHPVNHNRFEYTQIADGTFAYIKKAGLNYSICIQKIAEEGQKEYSLNKNRVVISSLSENNGKLYFSWTEPDSMPRLGILNLESGEVTLSVKDLSGGVYEPLGLPKTSKILYAGHFYKENRLFTAEEFHTDADETIKLESLFVKEEEDEVLKQLAELPELDYEKFNSFNYITRGIFIPLSLYETEYFGRNSTYSSSTKAYYLGASYITGNPWTDGSNDLLTLSAGWNYLNNSCGVDFKLNLGTDTQLFSTVLDVKNEFDDKGWKISSGKVTLQSVLYAGNHSYFSIVDEAAARIGRQDKKNKNLTIFDEFKFWDSSYFKCCAPSSDVVYTSLYNVVSFGYSNVHKVSDRRYNKAGLSAVVAVELRKDSAITNKPDINIERFNIYPSTTAYIPGYFPTKLSFDLLPMSSVYGYSNYIGDAGRSILDFTTETVLFGTEIQRALPFVSALYINDFYISMGYGFTLGNGKMDKSGFQLSYLPEYIAGVLDNKGEILDSIYLKSTLEITPNIGMLATSSMKMNLYSMISYSFRGAAEGTLPINLFMGVQTNF